MLRLMVVICSLLTDEMVEGSCGRNVGEKRHLQVASLPSDKKLWIQDGPPPQHRLTWIE